MEKAEYGIFMTADAEGQPYGVAVSHVVEGDKVYFHCAADVGRKIENIKVNNPHNLKYHLPDDGLVVTFRCANNKLGYANVENIMAFIDLSSVGAAESSTLVSVTFSYTDLISGNIYEIGNHTVEVEFIQANG